MRRIAATAALAAFLAAGCGGSDESPSSGAVATAGQGGTLRWALAERPAQLDPLYAQSPAERLVSRQMYEPLVAEVGAPFDDPRRASGLVLSARPAADERVWRLRLRPGVRFQDGARFDAGAVIANVQRWQAAGRLAPEPELFAFSPKPGQVTFKLAVGDPRFDRRLAAPSLGIVSPRALRVVGTAPLDPSAAAESGTGPFELRERTSQEVLLARNSDWWGTDRGLGPAIDQLSMPIVPAASERLELLRDGEAEVASQLGAAEARNLRRDPLLEAIPDGYGTITGAERSVRGVPAEVPAPPLNAAWLTRIAPP